MKCGKGKIMGLKHAAGQCDFAAHVIIKNHIRLKDLKNKFFHKKITLKKLFSVVFRKGKVCDATTQLLLHLSRKGIFLSFSQRSQFWVIFCRHASFTKQNLRPLRRRCQHHLLSTFSHISFGLLRKILCTQK